MSVNQESTGYFILFNLGLLSNRILCEWNHKKIKFWDLRVHTSFRLSLVHIHNIFLNINISIINLISGTVQFGFSAFPDINHHIMIRLKIRHFRSTVFYRNSNFERRSYLTRTLFLTYNHFFHISIIQACTQMLWHAYGLMSQFNRPSKHKNMK